MDTIYWHEFIAFAAAVSVWLVRRTLDDVNRALRKVLWKTILIDTSTIGTSAFIGYTCKMLSAQTILEKYLISHNNVSLDYFHVVYDIDNVKIDDRRKDTKSAIVHVLNSDTVKTYYIFILWFRCHWVTDLVSLENSVLETNPNYRQKYAFGLVMEPDLPRYTSKSSQAAMIPAVYVAIFKLQPKMYPPHDLHVRRNSYSLKRPLPPFETLLTK